MIVENNKIIEATEDEMYTYWLKRWSDVISFTDYIRKVEKNGTKIIRKSKNK